MKRHTEEEFAVTLVDECNIDERNSLNLWLQDLLAIKKSELTKLAKIKKTVKVTLNQQAIFPLINIIYRFLKKHIWDDRDKKSRLGMLGLGIGATFFAGQGAGIAALGGAIGVPLWVVFGAGGTFAGFIIEEIDRKNNANNVIDAEYSEIHDK